jgi:hypothetical protein
MTQYLFALDERPPNQALPAQQDGGQASPDKQRRDTKNVLTE